VYQFLLNLHATPKLRSLLNGVLPWVMVDGLLGNETWSLCPRFSQHNIIRNKWIYKMAPLKGIRLGWLLRDLIKRLWHIYIPYCLCYCSILAGV